MINWIISAKKIDLGVKLNLKSLNCINICHTVSNYGFYYIITLLTLPAYLISYELHLCQLILFFAHNMRAFEPRFFS